MSGGRVGSISSTRDVRSLTTLPLGPDSHDGAGLAALKAAAGRGKAIMAASITYKVTETTIRFTSPPYPVPTVEIAVETPRNAGAAALVDLHKKANAHLMANAHTVAAELWSTNHAGLDITIEPPHNGVVRVTMDAGRDEKERAHVLGLMAATLKTIGVKSRPQAPKNRTQPTPAS